MGRFLSTISARVCIISDIDRMRMFYLVLKVVLIVEGKARERILQVGKIE